MGVDTNGNNVYHPKSEGRVDGITIISGAILVQIVAIIGQCVSINGEC